MDVLELHIRNAVQMLNEPQIISDNLLDYYVIKEKIIRQANMIKYNDRVKKNYII